MLSGRHPLIAPEDFALVEEARHAPDLVPAIHLFDPTASMTVMDCLDGHIIMRKGMIAAVRYPRFAGDITRFLAETLFRTSDLALPAGEKKRRVAELGGNIMLWKITEDLIFTDPYRIAELNRWTSPQLDADAKAVREDIALKIAVSERELREHPDPDPYRSTSNPTTRPVK